MTRQVATSTFPAPAVAGDFASHNPRVSINAGPGAILAGPLGVVVGRFCWLNYGQIDFDNAPALATSYGTGPVAGIVGRINFQGINTIYLSDGSMLMQAGGQPHIFSEGDFWIKNEGTTQALPGQVAYAAYANGAASFAAAGSAPTNAITASIAAATASFTGSIQGNVLTVSNVSSGSIVVGEILSGTGVATGTQVTTQVSGTPGGVGVYTVNIPEQVVASTTISGTYGILTVTAATASTLAVGQNIAGGSTAAGTYITSLGTGTGGTGTYNVNLTQTVASTSLTAQTAVQTKFVAMSAGNAGELVKVSTWPLG